MGNAKGERSSGIQTGLNRLATTLAAWLAAFLLVMALLTLVGQALESWPRAIRALTVSGVLVVVMLNLVMPVLGPAVARWLAPTSTTSTVSVNSPSYPVRDTVTASASSAQIGGALDLPTEQREQLLSLAVPVHPLGYVLTGHVEPTTAPAPVFSPRVVGRVMIFAEYAEGLEAIGALDYAWLILWLDGAPEIAPLRVDSRLPHKTGEPPGVIANRAPDLPGRLGLSLVRVLGLEGNVLSFAGVDMVRGTRVLGIKPYVPNIEPPDA